MRTPSIQASTVRAKRLSQGARSFCRPNGSASRPRAYASPRAPDKPSARFLCTPHLPHLHSPLTAAPVSPVRSPSATLPAKGFRGKLYEFLEPNRCPP